MGLAECHDIIPVCISYGLCIARGAPMNNLIIIDALSAIRLNDVARRFKGDLRTTESYTVHNSLS